MASLTHDTLSTRLHNSHHGSPSRPSFSSQITSDRLRECGPGASVSATIKKPQRISAFREEGLDDLDRSVHHSVDDKTNSIPAVEKKGVKNNCRDGDPKDLDDKKTMEGSKQLGSSTWYANMTKGSRPAIKTASSAPPRSLSTVPRLALLAFVIALVVPGYRYRGGKESSFADAGVVRKEPEMAENGRAIEGRQNSPTAICTRWSHQASNVNGTLYIFGGQATTESGQTANTWNNNFVTLDLTKTWEISSPTISGLPQPPAPAVAEGYLWSSVDSLYLYGGEFSDNPSTSPLPVSTWEYTINSGTWTEHQNLLTSAGNNSDGGNVPVQRAAEGAGLSVPELGKSWYFGGHLDLYTTEGWSNQIARVYLRSLLEFTHPGYSNTGVYSLGSTAGAGSGGVYRNITQGGLQADAGFTERADGVIVYVPGWGEDGLVLGLAGGTNETFTEMNIIDVYDIASSTWYKQSTSGPSPPIRVDPCAVVAAAPDGTSFNVYLYGGQNLIPYGSQIQYSDMWILTVPSFTWIQVNMTGQSQPPARAGHTCNIWDGQIVVVGGYVGKDISCDSPGIYVFNASSLQWVNSFVPSSASTPSSGSSGSAASGNQQPSIIQGSAGYQVPAAVQSVIGGSAMGGATASTPAAGATSGPIATGRPPTFTITQSGSTIVQTAYSTSTASSSPPQQAIAPAQSKANVGAVIAGVIAAALAILAGYLAFCSWLYRRQLKLYRDHVAMSQRTAFSPENGRLNTSVASESGSGGRVADRMEGGGRGMLGPFGTEIGGSAAAGRVSMGDSPGTGLSASPRLTPGSGSGSVERGYGILSEADEDTEYLGASSAGPSRWGIPSGSTAHSSMEDLLGGLEPSFFSVVLNPRRTLRVVNLD